LWLKSAGSNPCHATELGCSFTTQTGNLLCEKDISLSLHKEAKTKNVNLIIVELDFPYLSIWVLIFHKILNKAYSFKKVFVPRSIQKGTSYRKG
jgi:hypothetical protein